MKIVHFSETPKRSIICKHIDEYQVRADINATYTPQPGDVALFRVKELGKHTAIQGTTGNRRYIFPGDIIMAGFGNRYATSQFEGYVPTAPVDEYHILGMGGAIGVLASMHDKFEDIGPTTLELLGYAVDKDGEVINTHFAPLTRHAFAHDVTDEMTTVLSLGSGMDSGKTTTAAFLCRGLRSAGKRPAYIKLTGTVYTKDLRFATDCGAVAGIDFSHAGFPSTYMATLEELKDLYATLVRRVRSYKPDVVVIEIADGLFQRETRMLIEHRAFMDTIDHVIFSGEDSLSAIQGADILTRLDRPPIALSGKFTAAPLLRKEVEANTHLPVLDLEGLEHIGSHHLIQLFNHATPSAESTHEQQPTSPHRGAPRQRVSQSARVA